MIRTLPVLLIALVALSLTACDRLSQSALDLVVGDCFVQPDTEGEVSDVQRAPCNEPHSGEVLLVANYPDQDAYPGEDAFDAWVDANCLGDAFAAYTGQSFEEATEIDLSVLFPTEEGWGDGDQEITCYLVPVDGSRSRTRTAWERRRRPADPRRAALRRSRGCPRRSRPRWPGA